jgi:hypothetical protein
VGNSWLRRPFPPMVVQGTVTVVIELTEVTISPARRRGEIITTIERAMHSRFLVYVHFDNVGAYVVPSQAFVRVSILYIPATCLWYAPVYPYRRSYQSRHHFVTVWNTLHSISWQDRTLFCPTNHCHSCALRVLGFGLPVLFTPAVQPRIVRCNYAFLCRCYY